MSMIEQEIAAEKVVFKELFLLGSALLGSAIGVLGVKYEENKASSKKPLRNKVAEAPVQRAESVQGNVTNKAAVQLVDSASLHSEGPFETGVTGNEGLGTASV